MSYRFTRLALAILFAAVAGHAAVPWHHPLYLANHGYWPQRVSVAITNASDEPVAGNPVTLSLPSLAGARVESLRACREDGVELLFDLRDARGSGKRTGALAANDTLLLPVECAGNRSTTVWVYAGNPQA